MMKVKSFEIHRRKKRDCSELRKRKMLMFLFLFIMCTVNKTKKRLLVVS